MLEITQQKQYVQLNIQLLHRKYSVHHQNKRKEIIKLNKDQIQFVSIEVILQIQQYQSNPIIKHKLLKMYYFFVPTIVYHPFYQENVSEYIKKDQIQETKKQQSTSNNNDFQKNEYQQNQRKDQTLNAGNQKCCQLQPVIKKKSKKAKDQQYTPDDPAEVKKKQYKQIQNRNIVPNLIRSIFTFINQKRKSKVFVQKFLLPYNNIIRQNRANAHKFYQYQKMIKNKTGNYVNQKSLQVFEQIHPEMSEIYSIEEQKIYNNISKIIVHYFLREEIKLNILNSNRMNLAMKKSNLQAARFLRNKLKDLLIGHHGDTF